LLVDHLHLDPAKVRAVADGEKVELGDVTLTFIYTPWVHWPETMSTWLEQDGVLFTCDFFGSHIASTSLYADDKARVYEAAKRYFAEIMMPFRPTVRKNVEKVEALPIKVIAPSHGSMYREPTFIIDAYKEWLSDTPRNEVVVPYVSMHGSTRMLVERLVEELAERGVTVHQFDLSVTDIGKLAMALVDAATIVIGTPTVHVAPHPAVFYAAFLANALRPKAKFASIVGSYGWATKAPEKILELVPNLKVEVIPPVMCKGMPRAADLEAIEKLAETIAARHAAAGLT
jgi:flavorubredoxin